MLESPRPAKRLKAGSAEEEAYSDHEGVEFLFELRAALADERAALAAVFRKGHGAGWARGGWDADKNHIIHCSQGYNTSLSRATNVLANVSAEEDGHGAHGGGAEKGATVANWYGVRVDADGHVVSLDLCENGLAGRFLELTPELRRLPRLARLDLTGNALTGPLPAGLLSMPALRTLHVAANRLTGALSPEFADKLDSFECGGNGFTAFWRGHSALGRREYVTETFSLLPKSYQQQHPASLLLSSSSSSSSSSSAATAAAAAAAVAPVELPREDPRLWTVSNIRNALPAASCTAMIEAAEACAAAAAKAAGGAPGSGWTTSRHGVYNSTTDIPVGLSAALLALVNQAAKEVLFPAMARAFGFLTSELWMQDCFVARYDMAGQRSLRPHLDGSDLSFVCALNQDFEGGGTLFLLPEGHEDVLVRQRGIGDIWMFCGQHWHSGVSITSGTRYILAGLVRIHTHDPGKQNAVRRIRRGFKATVQ